MTYTNKYAFFQEKIYFFLRIITYFVNYKPSLNRKRQATHGCSAHCSCCVNRATHHTSPKERILTILAPKSIIFEGVTFTLTMLKRKVTNKTNAKIMLNKIEKNFFIFNPPIKSQEDCFNNQLTFYNFP